ncbi:MAG: MBL fold metallo-hydrolase [Limisphaerales bacterium]
MNVTPHGAAGGEVTGSAYLIRTSTARVLVDFGLFQGGDREEGKNSIPEGLDVSELDAVVLTHAHLDHTGRLPLLTKAGYAGPVYGTPATNDLTALILRDSAKIQAHEIERRNRKRERAGEEPEEALYRPEDAETLIRRLQPVPYQRPVTVAPGIEATWTEAGHMLGSGSILIRATEGGQTRRIVFSGDLGPRGAPILRDFEPFHAADLVFLESTYGNRDHRPFAETVDEFVRVVQDAVSAGGKILVPTFAVGRAQLLTVLLSWMFRTGKVKPFPVFLDSPMAIEAGRIYVAHPELFDEEMVKFLEERPIWDDLKTVTYSETPEDSRRINDQPGPCLVMAGAGMCTAGRILHHFKHSLWRKGTHVLIVGYQSHGSLGRRLVEGEKVVSIHGEKIAVRAEVHTLGGFSAHAGQKDLIAWFAELAGSKPRVMLTHGEDRAREALAKQIDQRFGIRPALPGLGEVIEL